MQGRPYPSIQPTHIFPLIGDGVLVINEELVVRKFLLQLAFLPLFHSPSSPSTHPLVVTAITVTCISRPAVEVSVCALALGRYSGSEVDIPVGEASLKVMKTLQGRM